MSFFRKSLFILKFLSFTFLALLPLSTLLSSISCPPTQDKMAVWYSSPFRPLVFHVLLLSVLKRSPYWPLELFFTTSFYVKKGISHISFRVLPSSVPLYYDVKWFRRMVFTKMKYASVLCYDLWRNSGFDLLENIDFPVLLNKRINRSVYFSFYDKGWVVHAQDLGVNWRIILKGSFRNRFGCELDLSGSGQGQVAGYCE
jgi:hypothetical protein